MEQTGLRTFLEIPYEKLEELNLGAKADRLARTSPDELRERRMKSLADEKRVKALTVCFTDLEGRFHMLDYDKKYLLRSANNLTFDGSSVRGFATQQESDLRLAIDWSAFFWLPADVFGPGKVLSFAEVRTGDGAPYPADMRTRLRLLTEELFAKDKTTAEVAAEIEGFLFKGRDAERRFHEEERFEFISTGGYYHSLPGDVLRRFIDTAAEVQRAMGFGNEKDHPEVAPSQFEMNYAHTEALIAADQIQLYKLLCRQVAQNMDMTACFLPKPVTGVNGNGMHTNLSLERDGKNLFHDAEGEDNLSALAWDFTDRLLASASEICLILNSSVNAYRRLDPRFEAPNQIKASPINRGAMVRIPLGDRNSARIEVRSIAPDANPYLVNFALLKTGLEGPEPEPIDPETKRARTRFLPDNIQDALRAFKASEFLAQVMGEEVHERFAELKQAQAERCPKALGTLIKVAEVQFHHEVTNQYLWNLF